MPTSMKLDILSVEDVLYSGDAHFVVVPGESGELGIYPHHAPLLTRLRPGVVTLVAAPGGEHRRLLVAGGLLEVSRDGVTLIADHALRTPELDDLRAREARHAADEWRRRFAHDNRRAFDFASARAELMDEIRRFFALAMHRESAPRDTPGAAG
ncbi:MULTISPECIES: ATP synthase F1 subunit epsilon [unclassified Burkholderia]|uniref:ATP synthase F1 subunit epsilon n=1 Tax=unclassified Burkholderia TaxID=2613784 RepID=UPI0005CE4B83|nr:MULTISPECIES: ATP synthase F1 subunit epsilon [unclassified Burkholderia]RQR38367.1 ATP synthase F1 subunit epsilon [Burkholderia sp. Bp9131]RQR68817.1 ATP synthase F1 subunit epsilon [Burkholderia sp. Bp9015]RQR89041.1 ATP synthase F1 subunit epsilon [Burkholderia sp. Bp9011]RQR96535.1 ATP synthase F1 subunit epsilon [Burkholderia sp. Bp8991]RQR98193.1 ATP synthase F1 subunit epsilon [Burkholderia sp. Bp9010]